MDIKGKTVLVTGANRGIGAALVAELLAAGVGILHAGVRDPVRYVAPDTRVRALRRAISRAASASTWITPSSSSVFRLAGMKPAPMPWIGCGEG